ncbi:MAG: hypothetical protein U5K51_03000 [Flavobacteriaceae bacterium]|nr:hypothetical protein [Flavobacteriaceae bacterium]
MQKKMIEADALFEFYINDYLPRGFNPFRNTAILDVAELLNQEPDASL